METLGMHLSIPGGFAIYTIVWILITMVLSEIWWRVMKHFPEDEENYDPEAPELFEIKADR